MQATKSQAKKLGNDWERIQFTKNQEGERVMRFKFTAPDGTIATVDVQENGEKEVTVDGNGNPE